MIFVPLWVQINLNIHTRDIFSNTCGYCHQRFPCHQARIWKNIVDNSQDSFVKTWFDIEREPTIIFEWDKW